MEPKVVMLIWSLMQTVTFNGGEPVGMSQTNMIVPASVCASVQHYTDEKGTIFVPNAGMSLAVKVECVPLKE